MVGQFFLLSENFPIAFSPPPISRMSRCGSLAMRVLFGFCLVLVAYTYFGYAIWLWFFGRLRKRPMLRTPITPSVSIIIAARNEEASLPAKLENLRRLEYPPERLEIIVASDGSTDRTPDILRDQANDIVGVVLEESNGKAFALNEAVKMATGDILVFLDARQTLDANAVSELVACFADPEVGAVSGELLLETAPGLQSTNALGIYWKIEKVV